MDGLDAMFGKIRIASRKFWVMHEEFDREYGAVLPHIMQSPPLYYP